MTTLPTFDALYAAGKAEVQGRNPALTDFREGSDNDAVVGAGAMLADETIRVLVALWATVFLDTSEGADLDALIADRFPGFGVRLPDAAAIVTLRFTRGASVGVWTVPAGTVVSASVNGATVEFTTDTDTDMAAAASTANIVATCSVTGADGNIAAGVLTTIPTAIPGDATATVTNPDRAVGGDVEETDAELRDRARRYYGTLAKATVEAIELAAEGVTGVQFAVVDEANIDCDDGGYVSLYVGDPDGRGNDALAALADAVMIGVRAAGVEVRTRAAQREEFALAMTIYATAGADTAAILAASRIAVLAYFDARKPGEVVYFSAVECVAIDVDSKVRGAVVTTPSAISRTPALSYAALRVPSASLSITIVEV